MRKIVTYFAVAARKIGSESPWRPSRYSVLLPRTEIRLPKLIRVSFPGSLSSDMRDARDI